MTGIGAAMNTAVSWMEESSNSYRLKTRLFGPSN
jgi:hypothetical protein